MELNDVHNW